VQRIYFREGETVARQRTVLSIMAGNMKVRFTFRSYLPAQRSDDECV